ncbi:MAG TPA: serine hydrolase domain-containing protein [Thermomicrobiales bacterium]|nr:serine hydrolase domain-containing protein [Thermomicrobiales bacterium]
MFPAASLIAIGSLVQQRLDAAGAPGAAVAVTIDGEPWSAGIGHADLDRTAPMPVDALASAYSITKTAIAALALRLVDEKAIGLDDPIQKYLADLPFSTPVSIRQVLNHTGGIPDYGGMREYHDAVRANPGKPWSSAEFLRRTIGDELLYMPGHGWRYSNIGYLLLRLILEQETGLLFPGLVRHMVAMPLDLKTMRAMVSLRETGVLTAGYSTYLSPDSPPENVVPQYHPGWVSHGTVAATALDLARFLNGLLAGALFTDPALVEEMLLEAPVEEDHPWMVKPAYGLGLMIDPGSPYGTVAGHTGGGPGFATAAYRFPDIAGKPVTIVALVNRDGGDTGTDIVFSIAAHLAAHRPPR